MNKTRLEVFSNGVLAINIILIMILLAIPLAFVSTWISGLLFIAVALIWIVPDKRIESKTKTN